MMFDIDGTLVDSAGFDGDLYAAAAARVQRRFIALVRDCVARNPVAVREIAGARRLVERLQAAPGVRVAVATGGWEVTARLKLTHVGIEPERLALASSTDARARADIMRLAAERAMRGAPCTRVTYFDDGPWDQRASAELGYDFVAVGNTVAHDVAYPDLQDTAAIMAQLRIDEDRA